MDDLRRPLISFVELWQRMIRGQRSTTLALVVASAVGFFLLSRERNPDDNWVAVAAGRAFSQKEIATLQSAWRAGGLNQFRRQGNSLLVGKSDLARYESAIASLFGEKSASGSEWEKQLSLTSVFTPPEQLEQLRENALRNEVRRVLIAIPAIADAGVNWARSKSRTPFGSRPSVKATINVTPRDGHDLTADLAQSLRSVVASMVPDLNPEDVVVLDQSTGLAITDSSAGELDEQQRRRKQQRLARQAESEMRAALAQIPNATARVETAANVANAAAADSINWSVRVEIPIRYLDVLAARTIVEFSSGLAVRNSTAAELAEWRDLELLRLRKAIRDVLPRDLPVTDIAVEFVSDPQPVAANSKLAFAAWPHTIAGLSGILLIAIPILLRPRRRCDQVPRAFGNGHSEKAALAAAESPTTPITEVPYADRHRATTGDFADAAFLADAARDRPRESWAISRIQNSDPRQLAETLRHERPQTIAVLLTRLSDRLATACLSHLPDVLQRDVIQRLKSLGEVSPELSDEIVAAVSQRLELSDPPVSQNRITAAWMSPRIVKASA